ncbi:MAG: hypothetical protein RIR00_1125 [Pseudomonadota bacterium]
MITDTPLDPVFAGLEPAAVWQHFATLCRIPRPSKQEAALRQHLQAWAVQAGIRQRVDAAGNLILSKPARPGHEHAPGLILQAHLDMVCQQNSGSHHDFNRDPIRPVRRDGWLIAEDTTLGADNGIGVALILAALADPELVHGPLEALLTVDEEAGMGGAQGLAPGELQGRLMLNLDTEEWGQFYLGCAGGLDVDIRETLAALAPPADHVGQRLQLTGLIGGHSGVDIHLQRGNAIKLLLETLQQLQHHYGLDLRLAEIHGGTARNALAREAFARITLPAAQQPQLAAALAELENEFRAELAGIEAGPSLHCETAACLEIIEPAAAQRWLTALHAAPHGVRRFSPALPGVVETSNNLGILRLAPGEAHANFMLRSLRDPACRRLADELLSLFRLAGIPATVSGAYPGWTPRPDSPLLALGQQVYTAQTGQTAAVKVIHAGLECGILGAKYPGLDTLSFGPTIHGAHAPGERVDIASVGHCWTLLQALITALAHTAR